MIFHLQNSTISSIINRCVIDGFLTCTEYLRGLKQQMSASREKKTRQELAGTDYVDPKVVREEEQQQREKRNNKLYAIIAIVFVLVAVVSLVWKSQVIQKNATAVIIGNEKYTAAQANFYYNQTYQTFLNENYYFLSYMGLDPNVSLKEQAYYGAQDGTTWHDFFLTQSMQQMTLIHALNEKAEAEGFTWTEKLQSDFDTAIELLKENVQASGYYSSFDQYLTTTYGGTTTEKLFIQETKASMLAEAYAAAYSETLSYGEEVFEELYAASPKNYDQVAYECLRFSGYVSTTDEAGNTVEVTEEMKAQAMADAKANADAVYAAFESGKSLSDLAAEYPDAYHTVSGGTAYYGGDILGDWLFDDARKAGDTALLEDTATSAYYVVRFDKRFLEDYNTVAVRHVLLQVDESGLDTSADTYEADLQARKDAALKEAEDLLAQWKAGEATEESFAAMANEHSADGGSNTNGGLYSDFAKGYMVEEFNDWSFDPARKSGDTGIVYGESASYKGYHIMYFVEEGLPYWQIEAANAMMTEDMNAWYIEMSASYTAEYGNGIRYVG